MSVIKLSIIIPCYNAARYINVCLNSIYSQNISESDYEVICVDDKSSDNTVSLIRDFCKEHSNLKLIIHETNKKQGAARNTGLENAFGEYIWFIDSDDYIKENVFLEILTEAEKFELDILLFDYIKYTNIASNVLKSSDYQLGMNVFRGVDVFKIYDYWEITSLCWNRIIKRSFLSKYHIFFYEEFYFEDVIFGIICFLNSTRVKYLSSVNYYYRETPNSVMNNTKSGVFAASYVKLALEFKLLSMEIKDAELNNLFIDASSHYINSILKKVLYLSYKERIVFNYHLNRIEKNNLLYNHIENKVISLILSSKHFRFVLFAFSPGIRFFRFIKRKII